MSSFHQPFPLTLKLVGPAAKLGPRHGLVVLGALQCHSGGYLVGETTVKGGISLFERFLMCYGPLGNNFF